MYGNPLVVVLAMSLLLLTPVSFAWPDMIVSPAHADDNDDDGDDDDDDDDDDRPRPRLELIVTGLSDADLAVLARRGFTVTRSVESALLQERVSRILAPSGRSAAASLHAIRQIAPAALLARNDRYVRPRVDLYRPQGEPCGAICPQFNLTGWTAKLRSCALPLPIGVIDTRVDTAHPALVGARLETHTVRRNDRRPSDAAHGTGVVSLIVGQGEAGIEGVVPGATIIAVDPFHRSGASDATDAFDLVAALDILAERGVRIVNLSLSGPGNAVLEEGIRRLIARGTIIIAAAGPTSAAGQGFPARYDGVVAVASVDAALKPSRLSARGSHISYAGPGVGLSVASPGGTTRLASGTSFAAPFVSAAFAVARSSDLDASQSQIVEQLRGTAKDLGAPGRDPIFGWGLIQFPVLETCEPAVTPKNDATTSSP